MLDGKRDDISSFPLAHPAWEVKFPKDLVHKCKKWPFKAREA